MPCYETKDIDILVKKEYVKRLEKALETLIASHRIGRIKASLTDIRECQKIYYEVLDGKIPSFIGGTTKMIMDLCEIPTVPDGIGWKVKI